MCLYLYLCIINSGWYFERKEIKTFSCSFYKVCSRLTVFSFRSLGWDGTVMLMRVTAKSQPAGLVTLCFLSCRRGWGRCQHHEVRLFVSLPLLGVLFCSKPRRLQVWFPLRVFLGTQGFSPGPGSLLPIRLSVAATKMAKKGMCNDTLFVDHKRHGFMVNPNSFLYPDFWCSKLSVSPVT